MSLTNCLHEIIALDREDAISELAILKENVTAKEYRAAVKLLPKWDIPKLSGINESEINRRKVTEMGGFKLGDRVQVKSIILENRTTRRGRVRHRRIFYICRRAIVTSTAEICKYPSLVGIELMIVEFLESFVHCIRVNSGTDAPGLVVEDLFKL